jgi:serine/threonine-protein kinase HipA
LRSGEPAYIAKRFDRVENKKVPMEDFCQLTERLTEDKYHSSMERAGEVVSRWATNRMFDAGRFLDIAIHSFITGNADMHLKNFSLITASDGGIHLSPAYDLLSTRLLLGNKEKEESALPINGRTNNLRRKDFESLGLGLGVDRRVIQNAFARFGRKVEGMVGLVRRSFVPADLQDRYIRLIKERCERLGLQQTTLGWITLG